MRTTSQQGRTRGVPARAWVAGLVLAALGASGVALADPAPASVGAVSATFAATAVGTPNVQTCTGANGNTFQIANGTYSGTSTGTDPNLTGTIKLAVHSVYDTTTNLGWVQANVQIQSSTAGDGAGGSLTAVDVNNNLQGLITGWEGSPAARLLGSVSASFSSSGGFGSGELGAGTATNSAIATSGGCTAPAPPPPPPPMPVHPTHPVHPFPMHPGNDDLGGFGPNHGHDH